jgi:hypothetical protein
MLVHCRLVSQSRIVPILLLGREKQVGLGAFYRDIWRRTSMVSVGCQFKSGGTLEQKYINQCRKGATISNVWNCSDHKITFDDHLPKISS